MKKYVFRLETVRRVRKTQEDIAKSNLLVANTEVTRAIEMVEARTAEYEAASPVPGTTNVDGFMKQRYFNELSGQAVIAAKASAHAAQLEAAVKRDLYTEAAKRLRALERLDDRRRSEHAIEARRQEEIEVDDIVTGRHSRRSAG